MTMLDVIAFDADDTLWHNEIFYVATQDRFQQLLSPYLQDGRAKQELYETEMRNLRFYGYGIKGFALSMIETAIKLTDGRIQAAEIQEIVNLARGMLEAPVELFDHVTEVTDALSAEHTLMLITKGDLLDQQRKIERSGLASAFGCLEIVSDKSEDTYRALFTKYRLEPSRFLMVGNSLRSDILPVVALGGHAVHIPYHTTWAHEMPLAASSDLNGYGVLEHLGQLPAYVQQICRHQSEQKA
jgi:putative hydrolase of the HAD superfamily